MQRRALMLILALVAVGTTGCSLSVSQTPEDKTPIVGSFADYECNRHYEEVTLYPGATSTIGNATISFSSSNASRALLRVKAPQDTKISIVGHVLRTKNRPNDEVKVAWEDMVITGGNEWTDYAFEPKTLAGKHASSNTTLAYLTLCVARVTASPSATTAS